MKRRDFLSVMAAATAAAGVIPRTALAAVSETTYRETIRQTANMVSDPVAQQLARDFGLNILNVTWEDTGRYKGSSVGPNISDMTIQVQHENERGQLGLSCMPVIRYPNFSDKTADLSPKDFSLLVGNEKGEDLHRITLEEFLKNPLWYLHDPKSWKGKGESLWSPRRDSHVLVSAQACFLPVPADGEATFNPVLFNYQSYEGDPAVLTILATREGTSVTVIDNKRDGFEAGWSWGQRLYFNQNGERASFTGQRMSDVLTSGAGSSTRGETVEGAGESGLNMVLLIQVPLKQKSPMRFGGGYLMESAAVPSSAKSRSSDVEEAVIGHGELEGPFTEIDDLEIERDAKFPIRVTVQFYQATSNGVVSRADMARIARQIERVYDDADYVGSLVTEGETGRPTEYEGDKKQPADWWNVFWRRFLGNLDGGVG